MSTDDNLAFAQLREFLESITPGMRQLYDDLELFEQAVNNAGGELARSPEPGRAAVATFPHTTSTIVVSVVPNPESTTSVWYSVETRIWYDAENARMFPGWREALVSIAGEARS